MPYKVGDRVSIPILAGTWRITSPMGPRDGGYHTGYDLGVPEGTKLWNSTGKNITVLPARTGSVKEGNVFDYQVDGDPAIYTSPHCLVNPTPGTYGPNSPIGGGITGGKHGSPGAGDSRASTGHLHVSATVDGKQVDPLDQQKTGQASGGAAGTEADQAIKDAYGISAYQQLTAAPVSGEILAARTQGLVISKGLDNDSWEKEGLVGNPHLKAISPITFKLLLSEFSTDFLPIKQGSKVPLELRLNCSVSKLTQTMKHVINKANTRNGIHLTMWGMEPDVITGSGSTGVFLNSFGLTELMSRRPNSAFDQFVQDRLDNDKTRSFHQLYSGEDSLRVAAQDAFMELLSLFKNNGTVRFTSQSDEVLTNSLVNRSQTQPTVWSEQYGASTYERNARKGDIMTKGAVVMTHKNNIFQGYFKSLSWTQDADSPFHWNFDFTFQVQRTISYVHYVKS